MKIYSTEHILYLKKLKKDKTKVYLTQIFIIISLLFTWELLSSLGIINIFLFSSPKNILKTIFSLVTTNNFFHHVLTTIYEIIISTLISFGLGFLISTILFQNEFLRKVFDPYLTILNSLPKVALGPLIIIWIGASINSIIFMSLMISLFITIINLYTFFINTNPNYITLLLSMKATKFDIYKKVIIPSNIKNIISTLKINVSMNLIGVIMGELLVSKQGLGYLIMYGSEVFNINLVITSVFILGIISTILYYLIDYLEKK
ncbi:MAG: ABC transporter permease [Bacilli bacterium]|nr:ABC transporter permease [Bacilli bacterium]